MPNWASAEEQFSPNYPPPDHNLGQILNSDPASSYFPLKFADLLNLNIFYIPDRWDKCSVVLLLSHWCALHMDANPPYLWSNPKSPLNLLFMVQKATT